MFAVIFFLLALIAASVQVIWLKEKRTAGKVLEVVIAYLFLVGTGLGGLMAFYGHLFRADAVAQGIGWQPGSPFQSEIAVANLAFGVMGILCFWLRGNAWWVTAAAGAAFGWGAAYVHIRDIIFFQNYAPDNSGIILWFGDIFMPFLMLALLTVRARLKQ